MSVQTVHVGRLRAQQPCTGELQGTYAEATVPRAVHIPAVHLADDNSISCNNQLGSSARARANPPPFLVKRRLVHYKPCSDRCMHSQTHLGPQDQLQCFCHLGEPG